MLLKIPDPVGVDGESWLQKAALLSEGGWIAKDWDPAKHPRTGSPPNPGWFAPTDGGAGADSAKPAEASDPSTAADARIIPVAAGEEDERFPWEERDDEEGATYFNQDTGETVTLQPGSGVVLGSSWIRLPDLGQTYLSPSAMQTWANPSTFDKHYIDHADEFDAKDEDHYAAMANEFYLEAESQGYRRRVESNGTEYIYDPKTNTFGEYTIDGKTITFFKPTTKGYWDRQPRFVVKRQEELQAANTERDTMNSQSRFVCPICGYPEMERPARSQEGFASGEYCPCCGFQFGYHDDDRGISYNEWRRRWVRKGMTWSSGPIRPPPDWNPLEQLRQLSRTQHLVTSQEEFRRLYE